MPVTRPVLLRIRADPARHTVVADFTYGVLLLVPFLFRPRSLRSSGARAWTSVRLMCTAALCIFDVGGVLTS